MSVKEQVLTEQYAVYCADSVEVLHQMKGETIDLSIYSPPFA